MRGTKIKTKGRNEGVRVMDSEIRPNVKSIWKGVDKVMREAKHYDLGKEAEIDRGEFCPWLYFCAIAIV